MGYPEYYFMLEKACLQIIIIYISTGYMVIKRLLDLQKPVWMLFIGIWMIMSQLSLCEILKC